jgi:hypothetical protein
MRVSSQQSYKTFPGKNTIDKQTFDLIRQTANKIRVEKLKEGYEVILPCRLGSLQIFKFRPKKQTMDFGLFRKTGIVAKHVNIGTDGYVPMLRWLKDRAHFRYKTNWSFEINRNVKRGKPDSIVTYLKKRGLDHLSEMAFYKKK